jgi:GcrA cell cycle regulator
MIWSDEKIAELRVLWARGTSATIIAAAFGNVSRSAVLGKVHRLGLPHRNTMVERPYSRPVEKYTRPSRSKTAIAARVLSSLNVLRPARMEPTVKKFNIKTPLPELTKTELRAMLRQAVINTAAMS